MTYAYIRVSTEHQNTDNQYLEIETFAKNNDIKIDEWIIEKVSGTKKPEKRKLGELMERTKNGLIRARSQGKHIGRKKNQKSSRYKLTDHHQYIYEEIKNGRSINSLSKELGVAWATLKAYKVRSINQIKE